MDFLSTFLIVLLVIALAVPGFALKKAKLLPDGASNALAVLLLYVAQPFLMVSSLLNKTFTSSLLPDFAAVALFAVGLQLMLYFLSKLFFAAFVLASKRIFLSSNNFAIYSATLVLPVPAAP